MLSPKSLFDLTNYEHKDVFVGCQYVWQAIPKIGQYLISYALNYEYEENIRGIILDGAFIDNLEDIYIGEGTIVEPGAFVQGPAVIGKNCQIRSGAYIRGNVIIGDNCIVGHTSELKNTIMLNKSQCPHFNYVGDSILGNGVNLGCGTVLSNLPITSIKDKETGKRSTIKIFLDDVEVDTGLAKFGAIVGDHTETGCNSVLNPGCILGKYSLVYPSTSVGKGFHGHKKIFKHRQKIEVVDRNDI